MLREERQSKILEIIAEKEIETQEELCAELNKRNYIVTQATVSRDIKSLHLFKVKGEQKRYKYACFAETNGFSLPDKMRRLFKESIVNIQCARNFVIVKTLSGNASNAGSVLDKLNFEEIMGTVAGDDTVFVACCNEENAQKVMEKLNALWK